MSETIPLQSQRIDYVFNSESVKSLTQKYAIFLIGKSACNFLDIMRKSEIPFLRDYLPRPYENCDAIFLSKDNRRAMRVAELFEQNGYFNLGNYFLSHLSADDNFNKVKLARM